MNKYAIIAVALGFAGASTQGLAAPADQEACNKTAFELAELAAKKKLPEAAAIKVDELVSKLEGQCADGKLADADATAKEIEATLAK